MSADIMRQHDARFVFESQVVEAALILVFAGSAIAHVATSVTVNARTSIKYANNSVVASIPSTGLGLHTSDYANSFGNSSLSGLINAIIHLTHLRAK